jgi:hypothetical protein
MSLPTQRDQTIILLDYTTYLAWSRMIENQAKTLKVWDLINPDGEKEPLPQPPPPPPAPIVSEYEPVNNLPFIEGSEPRVRRSPLAQSELSEDGLTAWNNDIAGWKFLNEVYRTEERIWSKENDALHKIVTLIRQSVAIHLQDNCCRTDCTHREWLINLKSSVGVDAREERFRAREAYHAAQNTSLKTGNWDTWLSRYEQAVTKARTNQVSETLVDQDIVDDFLATAAKVVPTWATAYRESVRGIRPDRNDMTRSFREHMILLHPIKGRQRGAALSAVDGITLGAGGSSTSTAEGDTFDAQSLDAGYKTAVREDRGRPRNKRNAGGSSTSTAEGDAFYAQLLDADHKTAVREDRGRPRNKRNAGGRDTTSKRSLSRDEAAAEGRLCPACVQKHSLDRCFYVYKTKAPENWFPRPHIEAMVKWRLEHKADLKEKVRSAKRARTAKPAPKKEEELDSE